MTKTLTLIAAGTALAMTSGCSSLGRAAGLSASAPDEFRVVTKPPLTVPPEYNLRPPEAGETRPSELSQDRLERTLAFGAERGINASASERLLVATAGAIAVSPVVRELIDYEEAGIVHKPKTFADRVLFWRGSDEERVEASTDSATGGAEVTIERTKGPQIKLPGT